MEHLQAADQGLLFWFENHHSSAGNAVMRFCSDLGEIPTVFGIIAAAMILFWLVVRFASSSLYAAKGCPV
jgi:hypothetical protein